MPQPNNLDEYTLILATSDEDLALLKPRPLQTTIDRCRRIRGVIAYYTSHPTVTQRELVQLLKAGAIPGVEQISQSQAYEDIRIANYCFGQIDLVSKPMMRMKINLELEEDIRHARKQGDYKAVAALQKIRVANMRTDKEDELELQFDNIVPQQIEPTDDPSVLGFNKVKDLRGRIKKLKDKYREQELFTDYEELNG